MHMRVIVLALAAGGLGAQDRASWTAPQEPFKIYGNSYWVGTHGLGSILITSGTGHVLIDGALPEAAAPIAQHVRALGFRVKDIKLILNSHAHFDHAGGIAELQRLSGARVAASEWTAAVMKSGKVARDDPQFGSIQGIAPIARVEILRDGETLKVGTIAITAHLTPGHTPGGTSWTWQSCEGARCLNLVYADSLTPVSADSFRFSRGNRAAEFERSYAFLQSVPCDILLTPHPDVSRLWERLAQRGANPDSLVDARACQKLAAQSREQLQARLARERGQK